MLRVKNSIIYAVGLMCVDAALVAIAFFTAFYIRNLYYLSTVGEGPINIHLYIWLLPILIAVHLFTLWFTGLYLSSRRHLFFQTSLQVLQGVLLGGFISASIIFYTKSQLLSRLYFVIFSLILLASALLIHNLIVYFLGWLHKQGFHQRKVLVIANKNNAAQALAIFKRQPQWGFNVLKVIDPSGASEKIFDSISIDEVFLNITPEEMDKVQGLILKT
jgi:FlaA1/EpsC-like NDP-sugar epimerase